MSNRALLLQNRNANLAELKPKDIILKQKPKDAPQPLTAKNHQDIKYALRQIRVHTRTIHTALAGKSSPELITLMSKLSRNARVLQLRCSALAVPGPQATPTKEKPKA